jgi:prevent-host-death family protein
MREIQASEVQSRLPLLLEEVERGETVIITRDGEAIARLVPETERRQEEIRRTLAGLREFGRSNGRIAVEEILSAKNEGRK